jgi:DNA-binding NarL/FixJ family response regulator
MKKISVLLADDHTVVRQGLAALLECEGDLEIVGQAENGRQAVALARETMPEIVVMDVEMPLLNGIEATRQILKYLPQTKIIALSSYGSERCVREMVEAGALGYLVKQTAAGELVHALRQIRESGRFFSTEIPRYIRDSVENRGAAKAAGAGPAHDLTQRESEVLQLVAEGLSNKQVAVELGLSIKTVEKHRQALMDKLNIHQAAGLTRYAIAKGIIGARSTPFQS